MCVQTSRPGDSGNRAPPLRTALPAITDPVVIDATTQPWFAGSRVVELTGDGTTGSLPGGSATGLPAQGLGGDRGGSGRDSHTIWPRTDGSRPGLLT